MQSASALHHHQRDDKKRTMMCAKEQVKPPSNLSKKDKCNSNNRTDAGWEIVQAEEEEEEEEKTSNNDTTTRTITEAVVAGVRSAVVTSAGKLTNSSSSSSSSSRTHHSTDQNIDSHHEVTKDQIAEYRRGLEKDSTAVAVAQNACQRQSIHSVTIRRDVLQTADGFTFNVVLPGMPVTDQQDSGRCWLFATLNLFRFAADQRLQVDNFEFSEAYLHFWDKLEKANAFLEAILNKSHDDTLDDDDRTLQALLDDPIGDGGDWTIAASLIRKYGLVPKFAYPESYTSENTGNMNDQLEYLLLSAAHEIRDCCGCPCQQQIIKERRLKDVWRILCIHLGTPPEKFDWQWRDDDNEFHRCGNLTPLEFAQQMIGSIPWQTYVCLIHDPRHDYYQTYTVELSQTVLGGFDIIYLNVPIEEMKVINRNMLEDGLPVWFACNVGQEFAERPGLWDVKLYDVQKLYGTNSFGMNKADRVRYGYPMGTHAMLMTGVDIQNDGTPRRWKVENSWGTDGGHDGYYTMMDNWYDEYVFEIVVPPTYLTDEMVAGLKTEPIVLPAWDAMCARRRLRRGRIRP